ncbi:MAG: hypothetical protein KF746_25010 [Chitinophagaceae bacterium]|nr:hypothetical protein [Chitinophagaceae bacterium]
MAAASSYVISYHAIRKLIGVLGLLLPFLCWGVNSIVNALDILNDGRFVDLSQSAAYVPGSGLKSSISHFYYTASGPIFTGILTTVSVFLFCYKGYPVQKNKDVWYWLTDNRVATFAAICALGIVALPTGSEEKITDNIHIYTASAGAGRIHLTFAALFFLAMAVFCIINFRRHPDEKKKLKTDREGKLYLVCGWGMIASLIILAVYSFSSLHTTACMPYYFVYLMETVMLIFFAIAWLVKGRTIPALNKDETETSG